MKKPTNQNSPLTAHNSPLTTPSGGYSLIEVLIASGIFTAVMVIVLATFSTNSNIRNQTKAIRDASVSGRYAMEAVAREFRLANSYQILDSQDGIVINSYDENSNPISRRYYLGQCLSGSSNWALCTKVGNSNPQPLTSSDINVTSVEINQPIFSDWDSDSTPTMQPILKIQFTINANLGKKQTDKFTQTLETAVAGRAYNGFNSSIPVEQTQ